MPEKMENSLALEKGILNRIDPRVKILLFFLYAWTIAVAKDFGEAGRYAIFPLFLFFLAGFRGVKGLKLLFLANTFLFLIVISMLLTYREPPLFYIAGLSLSIPALKYGLLLIFKSNLILILMLFLISTTRVFSLFHALHHLKLPDKLVALFFFTYRYVHTVQEEYHLMLKSARARGFESKTSLKTYRTLAYILANLLVKSYKRADRVYKAMLCRGFNGTLPVYVHFKFQKRDLVFSLIGVFLYIIATKL